jgi:hypothetical protein
MPLMDGIDEEITTIKSVFGVITNDLDSTIVTNELGLSPTRTRQKGDKKSSRFSKSPSVARYGIWEISRQTTGEVVDLADHVEYFREILQGRLEVVRNLKSVYGFDVVFYVFVTTSDTVGGFELKSEDLNFIASITDRFIYRFASNLEVDEL